MLISGGISGCSGGPCDVIPYMTAVCDWGSFFYLMYMLSANGPLAPFVAMYCVLAGRERTECLCVWYCSCYDNYKSLSPSLSVRTYAWGTFTYHFKRPCTILSVHSVLFLNLLKIVTSPSVWALNRSSWLSTHQLWCLLSIHRCQATKARALFRVQTSAWKACLMVSWGRPWCSCVSGHQSMMLLGFR